VEVPIIGAYEGDDIGHGLLIMEFFKKLFKELFGG
jgi:hypothetical protein